MSLREITRASGTRNTVGLQYHFKDRNGVVRAILGKHLVDVDARRHALLDRCEVDGADLRAMAAALVMPSAAKLGDHDGGPEFLQIYAELVNRPRGEETLAFGGPPSSLERWRARGRAAHGPRGGPSPPPIHGRSGSPPANSAGGPRRGPTPTTACSSATSSTS